MAGIDVDTGGAVAQGLGGRGHGQGGGSRPRILASAVPAKPPRAPVIGRAGVLWADLRGPCPGWTSTVSLLRLLHFVLAACVLAASLPANGARLPYSGSVQVRSQDEAERADALRSALAKVVIERSGDAAALAREDVANEVAKADRYVLQYSYQRAAPGAPLQLVAQFDAAAVDALLLRLGLLAETPATGAVAGQTRVWIGGLHDADDWLRVSGYLARHPMLRDSRPLAAHDEGVLMQLDLAGTLAQFLDALAQERTLVPDAGAAHADAAATLLLVP
ncbi:MAG: DUF2066 domain-containing protein [Xanthomonadales bacterium]|nr:DUF2066 domain-containing protein [Xanthomonadales bacterium]